MSGPGGAHPARPAVAGTLGDGDALGVPWDAWISLEDGFHLPPHFTGSRKLRVIAPENGWSEYNRRFLAGSRLGLFSGAFAASFWECSVNG